MTSRLSTNVLSQTKGMTLEDISVLFGDPVELSFEQALKKQEERTEGDLEDADEKMPAPRTIESLPEH